MDGMLVAVACCAIGFQDQINGNVPEEKINKHTIETFTI